MRRGPALWAWIVGACMLALCASFLGVADAAPAEEPSVEVVGGTEARTVKLQSCPQDKRDSAAQGKGAAPAACPRAGAESYFGGKLTLLLRNGNGKKRKVRLSFVPNDGSPPIPLSRDSSRPVFLLGDAKPPLTVKSRQSLAISVGFAVPLSESTETIAGTLVVSAAGEKPEAVPVSGEAPPREFKGVSIEPSPAQLESATVEFLTDSDDSATVTLKGPELGAYLGSHGGEKVTVAFYDGDDTAEATLKLPEAAEGGGGGDKATATLTLTDDDLPPGEYTGKLVLPGVPGESGSASIELHRHRPWPLLVFLVLLGILTLGIGGRLVTTATRRKLLRSVLDETYGAFQHMTRTGTTRGWRLDDLLGEDPKTGGNGPKPPGGRLQGLPALRDSIANARSSADLDEDAARVLDTIARMQRWLRVEPLARRLALLAETREAAGPLPAQTKKSKENGKKVKEESPALTWSGSNTLRDTRLLLEMARREPADAEKADNLVARLLFQIGWHNGIVTAWNAACGDSSLVTKVKELDGALGEASKVEERTAAEQDALAARLADVLAGPPAHTAPAIGTIEGEPIDPKATSLGITPVKWDASPNLFTGWATLDKPSYGQLTRRAATSSRALYMPGARDLWDEVGLLKPSDGRWTLAILVVASATYTATTYSDTWGSSKDLATAFLAGALGKATVDWAALPIFQSRRLRKAATNS